jgi:hypothetical protein
MVVDSSLGRFRLATELTSMIFKEIDDLDDAIMLGLAHDTLMVIGWERIRALAVQHRAPWAGGRIICVGDYGTDLPEGVMSEEEQKEMYEEAYDESEPEIQTQTEQTKPFNLYEISSTIFSNAESRSSMDYQRRWKLSREENLVIRRIDNKEEGYYWEGGWVLMNLSKQQYVKSTVASSILPSMKATDAGCFGQLILSRICWSTDDSCSMYYEGPLHRGPWAGDRFRIVTLDVFERRTSGEEWKDVSTEAAEWLKEILSVG